MSWYMGIISGVYLCSVVYLIRDGIKDSLPLWAVLFISIFWPILLVAYSLLALVLSLLAVFGLFDPRGF